MAKANFEGGSVSDFNAVQHADVETTRMCYDSYETTYRLWHKADLEELYMRTCANVQTPPNNNN